MNINLMSPVQSSRAAITGHNQQKPATGSKQGNSKMPHSEPERLPIRNVTYKHPQRHGAKNGLDAEGIRYLQEKADRTYAPLKALIRDLLRQQGIRSRVDLNDENLNPISGHDGIEVTAPGTDVEEQAIDWGVQETADRIMNFAKSLAGDDPSKIKLLKDAVMQGFEEAKKALGGTLPQISLDTYDEVMRQFDEWENAAA